MFVEISLIVLFFLVGYILGRLIRFQKSMGTIQPSEKVNLFDRKWRKAPKKINIDETKFVTDVKTDSIEKDFDSLGEKIVSQDDIDSSVSKLSQLKGKEK